MTPKEYDALVRQLSPSSPIGKDTALAFVIGGGICAVGQLIANGWQALGLTQQEAASATSVTLVFLSVLLTALGLYHRLARYAGAGTLVPITGFANAVASPAIDFRAEGIVTGTAVKMFTVAGPVPGWFLGWWFMCGNCVGAGARGRAGAAGHDRVCPYT